MRLSPGLDDATERDGRPSEIATPEPDLAELVGCLAGFAGHVVLEEVVRGRLGRLFGFRPAALDPEHLGAVDATVASPATGQRRALAPLLELGRPLARAAYLQEVAAGADRPAVHGAGRGGPQVAGRRGCCCLVDQRPAIVDLAVAHEQVALEVQRQGLEVPVAELLRDLECPAKVVPRLV